MNKPKKNEIRIFAAFVTKGISLRLHQTKSVGDVAAVEIMGGQWISSALQMRDILTKAQPYMFRPVVPINPANTAVL